ncbi:MAG: DUF2225 domain-containing protein [Defluviitaleaceae bacterium]|nr:DUF2225 domain-containing protein [Defluviitaleaceae bacterium]
MKNIYDGFEALRPVKKINVLQKEEKEIIQVKPVSDISKAAQISTNEIDESSGYDPDLMSFVFEKSFECPVCDKPFKAYSTKTKVKLESVDDDLMPTYTPVDPLLYDALICPSCGYCALRSNFASINDRQAELILAEITPKYKHRPHPPIMSIDGAIADYKMALLNCVTKNGKLNEKGYICMKLSWLYKRKGDIKNELAFVKQAYENFTEAFSKESLPFCGLDENTVNYLLARFTMKLGLPEDSMRFISRIITSQTINPRLKERAIDMKETLRAMIDKPTK